MINGLSNWESFGENKPMNYFLVIITILLVNFKGKILDKMMIGTIIIIFLIIKNQVPMFE